MSAVASGHDRTGNGTDLASAANRRWRISRERQTIQNGPWRWRYWLTTTKGGYGQGWLLWNGRWHG